MIKIGRKNHEMRWKEREIEKKKGESVALKEEF